MQPSSPRSSAATVSVLCLTGFMGSGKSTVGALLARQLAWRFADLDERIEAASGLSIPQIFERFGEAAFRRMEREQLELALGRSTERRESAVLALGGGTYAQPANAELLRAAGVPVVWLDCPIEILLARCMTMKGRPLFRDEESFRELHAQRLAAYSQADHRVDTSGPPPDVVARILELGVVSAGKESHLIVGRETA